MLFGLRQLIDNVRTPEENIFQDCGVEKNRHLIYEGDLASQPAKVERLNITSVQHWPK
jgi:hypothetical protein